MDLGVASQWACTLVKIKKKTVHCPLFIVATGLPLLSNTGFQFFQACRAGFSAFSRKLSGLSFTAATCPLQFCRTQTTLVDSSLSGPADSSVTLPGPALCTYWICPLYNCTCILYWISASRERTLTKYAPRPTARKRSCTTIKISGASPFFLVISSWLMN